MIQNNITKLRKRNTSFSQGELAREIKVAKGIMSQIETGLSICPDNRLEALADALHATPADIYPAPILLALYGIGDGVEKPKRVRKSASVRITPQLSDEIDSVCSSRGFRSRDEGARFLLAMGLLLERRDLVLGTREEMQRDDV